MTGSSLTGTFGSRVKDITEEMIRRRLVHFLASDAPVVAHVREHGWLHEIAVGERARGRRQAGAGKVIQSLLYGVTASDLFSISSAAVVLLVVSSIAALIPARRASRVDPMIALRYE